MALEDEFLRLVDQGMRAKNIAIDLKTRFGAGNDPTRTLELIRGLAARAKDWIGSDDSEEQDLAKVALDVIFRLAGGGPKPSAGLRPPRS